MHVNKNVLRRYFFVCYGIIKIFIEYDISVGKEMPMKLRKILRSFILPLYSIAAYATAIKSIDFIVEGIDPGAYITICDIADMFKANWE